MKKIPHIAFAEDESLTLQQRQERRAEQLKLNMTPNQAVWALPNSDVLVCHTKNSISCGCIVSGILHSETDKSISRYDPMIINTLNREVEALSSIDNLSKSIAVMSDLHQCACWYLAFIIWRTVIFLDPEEEVKP